jgi:predicted RND superfamily exporter protein
MIFYQEFKQQFGEDGNMIAIALKDSALYQLKNFQRYRQLSNEIRSIEGIMEALSLPLAKIALKDTLNKRFVPTALFPEDIGSQAELDSLLQIANGQKFQINQLSNTTNGATRLIAPMHRDYANSAKRIIVVDKLKAYGDAFTKDTGIELHYAGLPFVRTVMATQVKAELSMFLYLSAIVTGLIMLLFFRSVRAVIFSMIMIGVMVIWVMGTITLMGYKISLLSGLIPPVIVTIGITNAIYLLNKYHLEFVKRKNKTEAIRAVVLKMGLATFLTNLTVAIGFLTLLSTDIMVLREFGIVAGLNIIALFVVTLVMIPGMLSWMPEPNSKHLKHLDFKLLGGFVRFVDLIVHRHRAYIYVATAAITVLSILGISRLYSVSYMVDDIPEDSPLKRDLIFLEENFSGFMPLEMVVDINARRKKPLQDLRIMQAVDRFEQSLDSITVTATPISVVSLVKTAKQAYHNNNPNRYQLPSSPADAAFVLRYMRGQSDSSGRFKSFIDSSYTKMRISMQMADIGSQKMDSLLNNVIEPKTQHLVADIQQNLKGPADTVTVSITGASKIFIKGSNFLIDNLTESLVLACVLITLSMALLFANARMILISLIPNLIALMITAGLMGYFSIPLKASTALIFSITYGNTVDKTILFMATYRQ